MLFRSDRKSTRLNSSHTIISYAVFCLKKKRTEPSAICSHRHTQPYIGPSDSTRGVARFGHDVPQLVCVRSKDRVAVHRVVFFIYRRTQWLSPLLPPHAGLF